MYLYTEVTLELQKLGKKVLLEQTLTNNSRKQVAIIINCYQEQFRQKIMNCLLI